MKIAAIVTLVFHALIIIARGHGIAPIGLMEVFIVGDIIDGDLEWTDPLFLCFVFTVFGQVLLISKLIFKINSLVVSVVGVASLFTALMVLDNPVSLFSGIPFILCGLWLLVKEIV